MSARSAQSQERIILRNVSRGMLAPFAIPRNESLKARRKIFRSRRYLSTFSIGVVCVSCVEETAASRRCLEKHAVSRRVRWSICHAMLHNMDIDARAQGTVNVLASRRLHDFLDRKVREVRVLPLQRSEGQPDFVSDLDFRIYLD